MTTAESNSVRSTVDEFRENLHTAIADARAAGIPDQEIFRELIDAKGLVVPRNESWILAGERVIQVSESAIQEELDKPREVCPTCGEEVWPGL